MVWPTVDQFHPDSYALEILSEYLSEGKRAPLNEVLIDEQKLTSSISTFNYGKVLSGEFYLMINANAGEDLDALLPAVESAFGRFEKNGISQADLDRIKAGFEVKFYSQLESVLGKAITLAQYNTLSGDPGRINSDIQRLQEVTADDVVRVYNTYIDDKPHVLTSFVPQGQPELALDGSTRAAVVEEVIVQGAETEVEKTADARDFERTPSSSDRTVEPPFGAPYTLPSPQVWKR